jgi:hypothetical protein
MAIVSINSTKAPALALTPTQFSQIHFDLLNAQLRVYFNTIDLFTATLNNTAGGSGLSFPHIAASDSTDQYATTNDTPTLVAWDVSDSSNGFTLASGAATAQFAGVYKITYSLQFANTANAIHDASVWLRVNGVDVARSTTYFSIPARKSAGVPSYICGYSEVVFTLNADDYVELYWATDQRATSGGATGVYIFADPAQTVPYARPAIPSAIGSITFVSRV